jgi:hypothetical protein
LEKDIKWSIKYFVSRNLGRVEMKLNEEKFSEAILQIKDNLLNMDEADCHALAGVLDNLAGIICPELLEGDFSAAEITEKYNFETLKGQIDILRDKELDKARRTLIACTCANLAFPIGKPEMHIVCTTCHKTKPKTISKPGHK